MTEMGKPNFLMSATGNDILNQIIFGEIPYRVRSVGIIPGGTPDCCERIVKYLRSGAFPYFHFQLSHGSIMDPFIVLHIDEPSIKELDGGNVKSYIIGEVKHAKWIEFSRIVSGETTGKSFLMSTENSLCKLVVNSAEFQIPLFDNAKSGIEMLRTNLDNPNKVSYTWLEIQTLNQTDELLYDIQEAQRLTELDSLRPLPYLHRGVTLNILDRLHAMFANLN